MTVRRAQAEDWPSMVSAFAAAGRAAWPHILPPKFLADLNPPDRWREAIDDPSQVVLVIDVGGIEAGFSVLRRSGDPDATPGIGELDSFYVHPDFWGRGAGRELLRSSVEHLDETGFAEATLWTAELNHRPRRIYEAAGWSLDGGRRERELCGRSFVELRYRIALDNRRFAPAG